MCIQNQALRTPSILDGLHRTTRGRSAENHKSMNIYMNIHIHIHNYLNTLHITRSNVTPCRKGWFNTQYDTYPRLSGPTCTARQGDPATLCSRLLGRAGHWAHVGTHGVQLQGSRVQWCHSAYRA